MFTPSQRVFWILVAVGLLLPPLYEKASVQERGHHGGEFQVASAVQKVETNSHAEFCKSFVDISFQTRSAHVASLCEISNHCMLAAWYGGTREGARDVQIYLATLGSGQTNWTHVRPVVSRQSAQEELGRYVKKVGNAVLFSDGSDNVSLIYVSVSFGGWSGSALNLKTSHDGGLTWGPSRRLHLSPFLNISELVKNQPALLRDGRWAVPIYHEVFGRFSELLWLSPMQLPLKYHKTRVTSGAVAFQPALVPVNSQDALLLARDTGGGRELWCSRTEDCGRSWSAIGRAGLPNPDSGLDAIRLSDGRVLLAFNDAKDGRENLRLALSSDEGRTWQRLSALLEHEAGEEFSYPFLVQSTDGMVHLLYTWKRKGISHIRFNVKWLDQQAMGNPK